MRRLLLILLPLFAAPGAHSAASGPRTITAESNVPGLAARCLWAERGWTSATLAFGGSTDPSAIRFAREQLDEHARLHGWIGDAGDGLSFLVTQTATCPPAALVEFSQLERVRLSERQAAAFGMLARAFAENGHVDRAVELLDELRSESIIDPILLRARQLRDAATWQAGRLLEQAGRWESALLYLDELRSTERFDQLALDRSRAHCLAELGRISQLESLVYGNLMSDTSCQLLELLLDAWDRSDSPKGLEELLIESAQSITDPFAKARLQAAVVVRFNSALQHRRVLALRPEFALEQLPSLLDGGDHHLEVQLALRAIGPAAVPYIQKHADNLSTDQLRLNHELYAILAATGLPDLEDVIRNVDEESRGFPYLEIWRAARALREDLPAHRSSR